MNKTEIETKQRTIILENVRSCYLYIERDVRSGNDKKKE
jgi:hypothetical protein